MVEIPTQVFLGTRRSLHLEYRNRPDRQIVQCNGIQEAVRLLKRMMSKLVDVRQSDQCGRLAFQIGGERGDERKNEEMTGTK